MKYISLLLLAFVFQSLSAQTEWKVSSPDKSLDIILTNDKGKLFYKVLSGDDVIIKPSQLGIDREDGSFSDHLSFINQASKKIDERYTLKIGKRKVNHVIANESSISFKNPENNIVAIDLRAYDDGVAFRYRFTGQDKVVAVSNEATTFAVPDGKVWLENYDMPSDYTPAYEGDYANGIPVGTNAPTQSGWAFPALFQIKGHWLLLTESNLDADYFGSHLQQDCAQGIYKLALPMRDEARGVGGITAIANIPFSTPWRMIITGRTPAAIVESNLVYHLAGPNKIGDDSWVKPGRASWSWWSDHPSSRDFDKLKKYVDLAADMGWEYSLVDANWNIMKGGNIQQLVTYAASKHISLALWYNSGGPHNNVTEQPRDIMNDPFKRKEEFKKLHEWGVKAVKVDFFQSDKQDIIKLYLDILKDAAKEKIMVIFHGCTLPRGWSRTYPNLLSMEAVKGAEQYGWDSSFANHAATRNTILVYTRNIAGPMDYTPVTFSSYPCCTHVTSNAHELALSVAFESGMLHFADSDSSYRSQSDDVKKFMKQVPNTWDDIKFLQGEPGKEVILARRKGDAWYIAGLNGENIGKQISIPLSFLNSSSYMADVFSDGSKGGEIAFKNTMYGKDDVIKLNVLPYGGFVIKLYH